ncbi:MAG TPA: hypothetical protein VEW66_06235 [Thermomicrobiales bacterium]|nr:hypothetical protein [Thermomicrobiales bacterium]
MAGLVGDDRIQRIGVGCSGTIFRKLIVARDGFDIFPGGTVEVDCCQGAAVEDEFAHRVCRKSSQYVVCLWHLAAALIP